jgi:glycosyltransferase involved in cell wall biosynthesis
VVRIPNGVDLRRFGKRKGPELRQDLGVPGEAGLVGMLGRLSPVKNLGRALRAFASVRHSPPPHLVVAGEGPERQALQFLADALGVGERVHWQGFVAEVPAFLAGIDVLLMSSDHEEHPRALLEAMAAGLPVVTTDVGEAPQVLPGAQAPYIVEVAGERTESRLAAAIERLLSDPLERERLGRANRARVELEFDSRQTHASYVRVYRDLLALDEGVFA